LIPNGLAERIILSSTRGTTGAKWNRQGIAVNSETINIRKQMKRKLLTVAVVAAALGVFGISTSQAALGTSWIRYSIDGGATWTELQDNAAGDASASDGVINHSFNAGVYSISIVSTISKPFGGITPATPFMDLQVAGIANGAGGLIVEFTDIGWTPVPSGAFKSQLAVNNSGALQTTLNTRAGANTKFAGPPFALSSIGPLVGLTTGAATAPVPGGLTAPYSITLSTVFANSGFSTISTDGSITTVPEGGNTLLLLGAALSALAFYGRSRKAKA
jgi:hypothetical protein